MRFGIRSMLLVVTAVAVACGLFPVFFPPLPGMDDFAPQGTIDAKYAWKLFGGRSIAEVKKVLEQDEYPEILIDEFQWMGDRAFVFYFPVVEDYVMAPCKQHDEFRHNRSEYLASCIMQRFHGDVSLEAKTIAGRVSDLASFVLARIDEIKCDDYERGRIVKEWTYLKESAELAEAQ